MATNKLTLFRFAKKVEGLTNQEKAALIAIADAQGAVTGSCWASIPNMAADYGRTVRSFQRGIHGYGKKDKLTGLKRVVAVGLVNRGLIYALGTTLGGNHANTTKWRINIQKLIAYLPEKYAAKLNKLLESTPDTGDTTGDTDKGVRVTSENVTGDKRASDGCHSAGQPLNKATPEKCNSVLPTVSKAAAGRLAQIFGQVTGLPLPGGDGAGNQKLVVKAMGIAPGRVVEFWKRWLDQRDLTGMRYPLGIFVSELPGLIGADRVSKDDYTPEQLAGFKARMDQKNEEYRAKLYEEKPERVFTAEDYLPQ